MEGEVAFDIIYSVFFFFLHWFWVGLGGDGVAEIVEGNVNVDVADIGISFVFLG